VVLVLLQLCSISGRWMVVMGVQERGGGGGGARAIHRCKDGV
jgi:hypothetical protein